MQTALPSLALPTQPCSRQSEPYMGRGTAARHSTFLTCAANSCAVSMTRAVSIRGGFLVVRKPETTRATRTGHLQTRKGHTHTLFPARPVQMHLEPAGILRVLMAPGHLEQLLLVQAVHTRTQ